MKKTAIITGSSRGIGLATAEQLALDGFNIVMVATGDEEKNRAAVRSVEAKGAEVLYIKADVSKSEDRNRIVEESVKRFGRIDVLVNNAGVAPLVRADLLEMTEESYDRVMTINTRSNMFMTQAVARVMVKQELIAERRGCIVNISSCSAEVSSTSRGEYCISKAGISMLTTLYADRLASEGILVNEVRPGVIATDMTSAVEEKYNALIKDGLFPIARWGKPEDVAGAVSALVSDKFLYTTGSHIDVDGGFHIKRL